MTLSLHKLWAGSGYEYLTRQVAALDASHRRGSLASYYSERGETPGRWLGAGLAGLGGVTAADVVTAAQMRALFGFGLHPLAAERREAARRNGLSAREVERAGRLGMPFRAVSRTKNSFRAEVDRRTATRVDGAADASVADDVRAVVVSEVAAEWFERDLGRRPRDARELAGAVARYMRPGAQPVAGFDLTFSPVKSVSALWAIADRGVAAEIERAHDAAVADAVAMLEQRALFTREGTNGVRQVEVQGLVAAAFTHRDSRAGDPDLHTHVAVANKVQTLDGRWLAIDGRVLYAATVTASETYNTALEHHLGERLGVRFADRATTSGGRAVRELVGVDATLTGRWSSRRQAIDARRAELARQFQATAGRPPTRQETWQLAQQATLETRDHKHEPRTLDEQRAAWHAQAVEVLGGPDALTAMVTGTLKPSLPSRLRLDIDDIAGWVAGTAATVIANVEADRATWQEWHLRAEALRQMRRIDGPAGMSGHLVDLLVAEALHRSVLLSGPCRPPTGTDTDPPAEPPAEPPADPPEPRALRRSDGGSVYTVAGSDRYSSPRILAAERRVLRSAGRVDGQRLDHAAVDVAVTKAAVAGVELNVGQATLVRELATSGRRIHLALAPAGTGKTTALHVLADAWTAAGGTIMGLAPSAAAARILGEHLRVPTDTLAKLAWSLPPADTESPAGPPPIVPPLIGLPQIGPPQIDERSLVLVDEAGLADTLSLDTVIDFVLRRGGSVRLIGDDRQLGAVGAGGLLRDLDAEHGAARLTEVVRFADPTEAAASLALRDGQIAALGFYLDRNRIHVGDQTTTLDQLFTAWMADRTAGLDTLMLAPTNDLVADLNARARQQRLDRLPQHTRTHETPLADGHSAGPGDLILCRTNDRRLRTSRRHWVRNGDRFIVDRVHPDGSITAHTLPRRGATNTMGNTKGNARRNVAGNAVVRLPAAYVNASVQLGYASTVHAAQGVTCDTVHGILTGGEGRAQLYTLLTRGRTANHLYLRMGDDPGIHVLSRPGDPPADTPVDILERIVSRDDTARSATGLLAQAADPARALTDAVTRYLDAQHVAADRTTADAAKRQLTSLAEHLVPGVTDEPAWPALYSAVLLAGTRDGDPARPLKLAVAAGPLTEADDRAAVLHQRVGNLATVRGGGPLPWLPAVPTHLRQHPTWGRYLDTCVGQITDLINRVHQAAHGSTPPWAAPLPQPLPPDLVGDIAVWRAAVDVAPDDLRPTGPAQTTAIMLQWQQHLDRHLRTGRNGADHVSLAKRIAASTRTADGDGFFSQLVQQLARLARSGVDINQPVRTAIAEGPLPDHHGYAALWWRLHRHLPADALATPPPPTAAEEPTSGYSSQLLPPPAGQDETVATTEEAQLDDALLLEGLRRLLITNTPPTRDQPPAERPEPTSATLPGHVTADRLRDVNRETLAFYRAQYDRSWAAPYLAERCRTDLSVDDRFQPGYAPHGWTRLVDHLRRLGVTDTEMVAAGVATISSRNHLIDRFRDRLILPIFTETHDLVGFVGRRHPNLYDHNGGPKYLNSPTTPLFVKSNQLYGSHLLPAASGTGGRSADRPVHDPPVPVLVEGPFDAVAVTLAGGGRYLGVAPLGTSLSATQAAQLAKQQVDPIVATDPDTAGRAAAQRTFWLLTRYGLDPRHANLTSGLDPAATLEQHGPEALHRAIQPTDRLGDQLLRNLADRAPTRLQTEEALKVIAARPPHTWTRALAPLGRQVGLDDEHLRRQLLTRVRHRSGEISQRTVEALGEGSTATRQTLPPTADRRRPTTSIPKASLAADFREQPR